MYVTTPACLCLKCSGLLNKNAYISNTGISYLKLQVYTLLLNYFLLLATFQVAYIFSIMSSFTISRHNNIL